jgi:predicted dehydrogenase
VHVLTPPASHATLAIEALDMGCGVLVEKPMADTVAECTAMIDKAREKGLILGVNHSDLLDPVVMKALQAVRAGRIGEVVSVDILRSSEYPAYAGGPLPGQVAQGSYPFRDLGVHGLYTLEAFLGPLSRVEVGFQASGRDPNLRFDEWQAQAKSETGFGRLLLSWNARPMENRLVVRGTRGIIEADRFLQIIRIHRVLPGPKFIGIVLNTFLSAAADVFRVPWNVLRFATGMLKPSPGIQKGAADFAAAARDNGKPPFDGADALRVITLLEPLCVEADRLRREEIESRYASLAPADALVTGAAGFLGRAVVKALRARGQTVRVLLRKPVASYAGDAGLGSRRSRRSRSVDARGGRARSGRAGLGTRNISKYEASDSRLVHVGLVSEFDHVS